MPLKISTHWPFTGREGEVFLQVPLGLSQGDRLGDLLVSFEYQFVRGSYGTQGPIQGQASI